MNKSLYVFILKLYKNEQKCLVSSRKFSISYSVLNLPGMFQKMICILSKSQKQNLKTKRFFTLIYSISNLEIILFTQKQEQIKIVLYSVIINLKIGLEIVLFSTLEYFNDLTKISLQYTVIYCVTIA